jgi:hypothetical protein
MGGLCEFGALVCVPNGPFGRSEDAACGREGRVSDHVAASARRARAPRIAARWQGCRAAMPDGGREEQVRR